MNEILRKNRPVVAISMGDPAGIGPEVVVKALDVAEIYDFCRPLVIGELSVMQEAVRSCRLRLDISSVPGPTSGSYKRGRIDLFDMKNIRRDSFEYGRVSRDAGRASFEYVTKSIEMALATEVAAIVTGPINKEALNLAGHHYAGHTEILADMTKTSDYAMMLVDGSFRVIHVSTHVALRHACDLVRKDRILRVIHLADDALRRMGIARPRIGVAGLNPHCGEHGLFGYEDRDEIEPAIEYAHADGVVVEGPIPSDTVFSRMRGGEFDVVVAMYHDQGHIATKLLGFRYDHASGEWSEVSGVNVTLGLPIVRTSVDHGTAFDKAGKGTANPQSMIQALKLAVGLSTCR
jgi:4-hydroxythreonine-4-phosphate dehydrogenase